MTRNEIKEVLVNKFNDEGCCFTAEDIIITKNQSNHIVLHINEYEHITIDIKHSDDPDYIKYDMEWMATAKYTDYPEELEWLEATNNLKTLLIYVAYNIAQTF